METGEEGRLVVVSGAAKGIGKSCVELFVERGWKALAIDLDKGVGTAFSETAVTGIAVDVTCERALRSAFDDVGSPVTAVVNAAGVFPPTSLTTFDEAQYRSIFDVNVLGSLLVSREAVRSMPAGGAIVNLCSTNGFVARPDQLLYAASKAAILSVTRSLAAELAPRRIRVNGIAPGPVDTEGFRALPGRAEQAEREVPLGRIQTAAEVAELAYWLVEGSGAQFITGETIVSSGGLFMR